MMVIMQKKINKCSLCENCPINTHELAMSHYALKSIELIRDKRDINVSNACPFYINSKIHGYCFWIYIQSDFDPMSIQDIATMLCITPAAVKQSLESALKKIKKKFEDGDEYITDFIDYLRMQCRKDAESLSEGSVPEYIQQRIESVIKEEDHTNAKRIPRDMPLHRSGKKTDIYGIYSEKSLKRYHRNKRNGKKNKPE